MCLNKIFDTFRRFRNKSKYSQEVAISQSTLNDIIGLNAIREDFGLSKNLCYSLPFEFFEILAFYRGSIYIV